MKYMILFALLLGCAAEKKVAAPRSGNYSESVDALVALELGRRGLQVEDSELRVCDGLWSDLIADAHVRGVQRAVDSFVERGECLE